MRLVRCVTSAGDRPAGGAPGPVNRRRAIRARERLDDRQSWRLYLGYPTGANSPDDGWEPDITEDGDDA